MKPDNWDNMDEFQKQKMAVGLLKTARGQLLMAQALVYGIKAMREVPAPYTEISNIQDLEMIRETIFIFPVVTQEDRDEMRKLMQEVKLQNNETKGV